MNPNIEESWKKEFQDEFEADYFQSLKNFLIEEKKKYIIYPQGKHIFEAFNLTPFDKVKVVIIGQDPYHGHAQAHGLCFSVQDGIKHPPSLVNIFKELQSDLNIRPPVSGNLTPWAKQGVLLINATLTVRASQAGSHQNKGWENFTDAAIKKLSEKKEGLVFLLWGNFAIAKEGLIDARKHFLLKAAHPSPFSVYRGFFGCKHFSQTNNILQKTGKSPINWDLNVS
ncbi:MAG: uracil-DNA glycosylase [Bacteroidales bacterium]|nr:uracil-DNA glycosylase [Bacteroidales bacterium]